MFFLFPVLAAALLGAPAQFAPVTSQSTDSRSQIGNYQLSVGRLDDAKASCDAALSANPLNQLAKTCLVEVAFRRADQDLNTALTKLLHGDSQSAVQLSYAVAQFAATRAAETGLSDAEKQRARELLTRARFLERNAILAVVIPEWLRQILVTIGVFLCLAILLIILRKLWRVWQGFAWSFPTFSALPADTDSAGQAPRSKQRKWRFAGKKTHWTLLPLNEVPGQQTGTPTTYFFDALTRLPALLERPLWKPHLLILRPTPPEDHAPPIIDTSISRANTPKIVLLPEPHYARIYFEEHDVQLDDAAKNLQMKISAGIDLGTVAKFMSAIFRWLKAGSPVISGTSETKADGSVTVEIAATRSETQCVSVTASVIKAPGIDTTQLAARRAALKLVLRHNHPEWTDNEVEGFAALRQAVIVFSQFAGTAKGIGESVHTRVSSLQQAASDFALFRASIPFHCMAREGISTAQKKNSRRAPAMLIVSDEVRQADLLAEGVVHALLGGQRDLETAVVCFRQLQDWPGSVDTVHLRQQAAYNEAIVWRQMGSYGHAVLMLTELLGEHPYLLATDRPEPAEHLNGNSLLSTVSLAPHDPLRIPARLARFSAFGEYTANDWKTLPEQRIALILQDASSFIDDLTSEIQNLRYEQELHIAQYMYLEGLRAVGHVEVLAALRRRGERANEQDTYLTPRNETLSKEEADTLRKAVSWMQEAERVLPTPTLYCDLAQAYILLGDLKNAQSYARDALLQESKPNEYAVYLAAESYFLEGNPASIALAREYADRCLAPVRPDLIALRNKLHAHRTANA